MRGKKHNISFNVSHKSLYFKIELEQELEDLLSEYRYSL